MAEPKSNLKRAADAARKRVSGYAPRKRAELTRKARAAVAQGSLPPWRKPPVDVPVQALREFMAKHGADVSVLTTWTHETNCYQFVTVGADWHYANSAVNLRNVIAGGLDLHPLDPKIEDLRSDHPNVALSTEQIQFLLWVLGRLYAETDKRGKGFKKYVRRHHDALLEILSQAKSILTHQPK
jgi:hypothetical protein